MNKIRKINALTVAVILTLIAIVACSVILILHNEFGLLFGEKNPINEYEIEFTVMYDGYVSFDKGQHLYLSGSRESLGFVNLVKYESDGTMIVSVRSMCTKKDGAILLNGNTYVAKGTEMSIMNNNIDIKILNVNLAK